MKVKLTEEQIQELMKNPEAKVHVSDPWYIVVLKVLAYVCGLLLAGYGTATAATVALPLF